MLAMRCLSGAMKSTPPPMVIGNRMLLRVMIQPGGLSQRLTTTLLSSNLPQTVAMPQQEHCRIP